MAKTFLRSGNLDAVLALGENGQPVYLSALQLRETLRLRKQQKLADCLAIPQANEQGDRLDWYAPFHGRVKSWLTASEGERRQALAELESYQKTLTDISARALSADKPALKLFGALLSKAFQFPDRQYVYLVSGRPVITFWGFVELDKRSRSDALDCLRSSLQPEPLLADEPALDAPVPAALSVVAPPELESVSQTPVISASVSAYQAINELNDGPETEPEPQPAPAKRTRRRLWVIPPLVLAVAAALAINVWTQESTPPLPAAATKKTPETLPEMKTRAPVPPATQAKVLALPATLPLRSAVMAAAAPEPPAPVPTAAPAPAPNANDALVMPADAVRIGSIKFLDGNWRASIQIGQLRGFKAPTLRYQFRDGKGTATIVQGDGTRCKAETTAGLMSSGNLIINSRYTARCANGTRYKMPQLVCKQGESAAVCEAQFGSDVIYPTSIKRESK